MAQPLEIIRGRVRPAHIALVDAVVSSLWTDFVVPYVGADLPWPPNEESFFLERLQASRLWDSVLDHVGLNRALQQKADERTARCRRQSASIFQPGLERPLWAVLAIQAGLMPPAELAADSEQGAPAVAQHEDFEYQEPPWEMRNGEYIVKGTNLPFDADERRPRTEIRCPV